MKKLIISLFAAVMMTTGFVGLTSTAASAAQCDRYGVCVKPKPNIEKPENIRPGETTKVKLKLKAPNGDATVQGTFKMIIKRLGGPVFSKSEKSLNRNGAATMTTPELPKGKYKITIKFIPAPNTPWERITRISYLTVR